MTEFNRMEGWPGQVDYFCHPHKGDIEGQLHLRTSRTAHDKGPVSSQFRRGLCLQHSYIRLLLTKFSN